MIAMALALNPRLLIADEPTTALDVTIQAQILDLMRDLRRTINTSVILITHDLGVIAEMADRVAVMYAGRIIEKPASRIFLMTPASLYAGPDRVRTSAGPGERRPGYDPGQRSKPDQPAGRLPFCRPLRAAPSWGWNYVPAKNLT
jgi:ABC-type glutathione transport system ATPase component